MIDQPGTAKVRVGFGLGTSTTLHGPSYGTVVDALESLGFDEDEVGARGDVVGEAGFRGIEFYA